MIAKELFEKLQGTPSGQRTSLENLLMVSVERGRISSVGAAMEEYATLRTIAELATAEQPQDSAER